MERDNVFVCHFVIWDNFNSHAHVERDLRKQKPVRHIRYFNSHAHVERDLCLIKQFAVSSYFNSHAHVERDREYNNDKKNAKISTHTLTWSVTQDYPR